MIAFARLFLAAAGFVLAAVATAAAQQACVVCTGPDATYRCSIEKSADKLARFGAAGDKALSLVCAKELAKQGGHEKCAARRNSDGAACEGSVRELPLASVIDAFIQSPPAPAPATPEQTAAVDPAPAVPVKAAPATEAPPRTVLELAERTGEQSKQQLKKVGTAAERTWECIASLFSRC